MFPWLGDGSVGNALVQPWEPEDGSLEVTGKVECGSPRLETQCDEAGSRWISGAYCAANLDCLQNTGQWERPCLKQKVRGVWRMALRASYLCVHIYACKHASARACTPWTEMLLGVQIRYKRAYLTGLSCLLFTCLGGLLFTYFQDQKMQYPFVTSRVLKGHSDAMSPHRRIVLKDIKITPR